MSCQENCTQLFVPFSCQPQIPHLEKKSSGSASCVYQPLLPWPGDQGHWISFGAPKKLLRLQPQARWPFLLLNSTPVFGTGYSWCLIAPAGPEFQPGHPKVLWNRYSNKIQDLQGLWHSRNRFSLKSNQEKRWFILENSDSSQKTGGLSQKMDY